MKNPLASLATIDFSARPFLPAPPPPKVVNKGLGWLGVGLGAAELIAAPRIARALGAPRSTGKAVLRAFGARELARRGDPRRKWALVGLGVIVGATALDLLLAARTRRNAARLDTLSESSADPSGDGTEPAPREPVEPLEPQISGSIQ